MKIEPSDYPHLLEWHAAHCLTLAEACKSAHASKVLRLLAADLTIEAEILRRKMKEMGLVTTVSA